jgi:hypothetical protein
MTTVFDAYIDKITNSIEIAATGQSIDTKVLPVQASDLKSIIKKNGWNFDWKSEYNRNEKIKIIKLVTADDPLFIQGLASYEKKESHYYMPLIESAPINIGTNKVYVGVPGNLVSFICLLSLKDGFSGVVSFPPKTKLIEHYHLQLGAVMINKTDMAIYPESAKKLINSYYKNEW